MSNELIEAVEKFGTSYRKGMDAITERVESLEAQADRPKGVPDTQVPYGVHHVDGRKQFSVPSSVKLQDIPELSAKEKPTVSMDRWLHAVAAGDECKDTQALEYAREKKQLTTGTTGVLIPTEYQAEWIDLIRSQMVLNRAGMTTVPMDAKSKTWAAVTADPSATWHAEAGAISASNPTFASRTLTANTVVIRSQGTMELAQDCPDFGAQLSRVLTGAIAAEIDKKGLHGAGGNDPQGIYGASGITTTATVGTPTDFSDLTGGVKTLMDNNVPLDVAKQYAIMSPRTWLTYENLVTGITSDKTPLMRPPSLQDMEFLVSTNVSNTLDDGASPLAGSAIFLGDFKDLVMGIRQESSIEVIKADSYVGNLVLDFIAYARVDFVLARPASFVVLDDVQA